MIDANWEYVSPTEMNNGELWSRGQLGCDYQAPAISACLYPSGNPVAGECPVVTPASRKRSTDDFSFLDEHLSSQILQQQLEINCFINHHTEKLRWELSEWRKRQALYLVGAVKQAVERRLREKEEEMEKMRKLNWVLEERTRELCLENQIWRELAWSNEAAANALRFQLEQLLADRVWDGKPPNETREEAAENAESCCDSSGGGDGGSDGAGERSPRMGCGACRLREANVLVLPCRHLCLCATCVSGAINCPICHTDIIATVNVNKL